MTRMPAASYDAMKKRLREVLQHWGIWTPDELEVVATFVEREVVLYATQTSPVMPPKPAKSRKNVAR
jgi:hypothetical protein